MGSAVCPDDWGGPWAVLTLSAEGGSDGSLVFMSLLAFFLRRSEAFLESRQVCRSTLTRRSGPSR